MEEMKGAYKSVVKRVEKHGLDSSDSG